MIAPGKHFLHTHTWLYPTYYNNDVVKKPNKSNDSECVRVEGEVKYLTKIHKLWPVNK